MSWSRAGCRRDEFRGRAAAACGLLALAGVVSLILGLVRVVVGVALVTRPFTSFSVLAALAAAALLVTGMMELAAVPLSPSALVTGVAPLRRGDRRSGAVSCPVDDFRCAKALRSADR